MADTRSTADAVIEAARDLLDELMNTGEASAETQDELVVALVDHDRTTADSAAPTQEPDMADIKTLVDRFLAWPLPQSVCADLCATDAEYPHSRSGTNLLTADEARQMLEYVLADSAPSDGGWRRPKAWFDVGAGKVREGDTALYDGRKCKVLTVYQDGDVQIEVTTYPTVKWRQVTPLPSPPRSGGDNA